MRILRRRTLERRLFFWLIGLALIPAFVVLGAAAWIGHGTLNWLGTLGPWAEVSESGRALINAAEPLAHTDTALARTIESHRVELTASLTQASRWSFLGARVVAALPVALLLFALLLIVAALLDQPASRASAFPAHPRAGQLD